MDLRLTWLVLTHHHHHHHQQLPSSPSPRERVSSSFLLAVVFFWRADFCPTVVWLGLELLPSSPLEWITCESSPLTQHSSPLSRPRLLSPWSCSLTVPLTLVLRLLASAELRLYRTSLPRLIISRTIWSEWTKSRWSPWLVAECPLRA